MQCSLWVKSRRPGCLRLQRVFDTQPIALDSSQSCASDAVSYQGSLRSAPVRVLPRVCAPAQPLEIEVPSVAEEVPQLREKAIGYVPQPKDSYVLTPALRAAGPHAVFGGGLCRFERRE